MLLRQVSATPPILLLRVVPVNEVRPAVCVAAPSALGFACGLTGTLLLLAGVFEAAEGSTGQAARFGDLAAV